MARGLGHAAGHGWGRGGVGQSRPTLQANGRVEPGQGVELRAGQDKRAGQEQECYVSEGEGGANGRQGGA